MLRQIPSTNRRGCWNGQPSMKTIRIVFAWVNWRSDSAIGPV
jgi:hypothetical protein